MRKQVLIAVLGVAMLLVAGAAEGADVLKSKKIQSLAGGNVPSAMLADMGLEGMEVLSDAKGTEVRGNGFFFFFVGFHHPFHFHHHHHPFVHHHHHSFFFFHHAHHGHFIYPHVW